MGYKLEVAIVLGICILPVLVIWLFLNLPISRSQVSTYQTDRVYVEECLHDEYFTRDECIVLAGGQ